MDVNVLKGWRYWFKNAADEVEQMRATFLSDMQWENGCQRTGKPCDPNCGCEDDVNEALNEQIAAKEDR